MIWRVIWFAGLLATALLTAALQVDKQTETHPELAPLVPEQLRNYAQVRVVQNAAQGDDPARALAEARKLVQRRPVPAEYLSLLALAQAKAGEDEAAGLTFQIAGKRGWREPVAQELILRLALAAGDEAEVARRYTALLLRDSTPDALLSELGPTAFGEPGSPGQVVMAEIVVGGDRWHGKFLRRGSEVMPPAAFSAVLVRSMAEGAAFECDALVRAIKTLARRDPEAARLLQAAASGDCPRLPRLDDAAL